MKAQKEQKIRTLRITPMTHDERRRLISTPIVINYVGCHYARGGVGVADLDVDNHRRVYTYSALGEGD